jgi:TolA-binding protein
MCHSISNFFHFLLMIRRKKPANILKMVRYLNHRKARSLILGTLFCLSLPTSLMPALYAAPDKFKPILPLPLSWTPVRADANNANYKNVFQNKPANDKSVLAFKESMKKLSTNLSPADQAKEINALRFSATKLGPKAKLMADLVAAQATSGLTGSGVKKGGSTGNWRGYLLSACNTASKIDESTHEKTALFAIALWRRADGISASWMTPPIDAKAQRQFKFFMAIVERQALELWDKGQPDRAFKIYRSLATTNDGTTSGGALDLRTIELERSVFNKQGLNASSVRRWQSSLLTMSKKYGSEHALGDGNEGKVQVVAATVAAMHRTLMRSLIVAATPPKAADSVRNEAIAAINLYLDTNLPATEKLQIQESKGNIEFNGKMHQAAVRTFSELASEAKGNDAAKYWKLAIRSQLILALWPADVPWDGTPKGEIPQREALLDLYKKFEGTPTYDWAVAGHVGLLLIANSREDDAYKLWTERLQKFPAGNHPMHATGLMAKTFISAKNWVSLENLARIMTKGNITGTHLKTTYKPHDVLGLAILETGLQSLAANDFKTSVDKLKEYVNGWNGESRHHEGLYHLALAYSGDKQFRTSVLTLETFVKKYPSSKWFHDALITGGNLTMGLAWDEHVIFFLETQIKTFPRNEKSIASEQTLADLYMGRGIYDSAIRIMSTQLANSAIPQEARLDIARRMIDTAERYASPQSAIALSSKLLSTFKDDSVITSMILALKARMLSDSGNISGILALEKTASRLDLSLPQVADAVSEVKFLVAQTLAKGKFDEEVFSLASKNPKADLESGYALYSKIITAYNAACLSVRTSWCGPALHRSAALGDKFVTAYTSLTIAETLAPEVVLDFTTRKTAILDSANSASLAADEKSVELARLGSSNPDWTSAILLQSGRDASAESFTRETANHFIQWHTK